MELTARIISKFVNKYEEKDIKNICIECYSVNTTQGVKSRPQKRAKVTAH